MWTKMKILQRIVYVISQLIVLGGREIAQGGGEILPTFTANVSSKFWENIGSSKFHQNCNTIKQYI